MKTYIVETKTESSTHGLMHTRGNAFRTSNFEEAREVFNKEAAYLNESMTKASDINYTPFHVKAYFCEINEITGDIAEYDDDVKNNRVGRESDAGYTYESVKVSGDYYDPADLDKAP